MAAIGRGGFNRMMIYIKEHGHVMTSMSANVHDRAQHSTKMFYLKNELSLVITAVVFTGMEAPLFESSNYTYSKNECKQKLSSNIYQEMNHREGENPGVNKGEKIISVIL